MSNTTQLYIQAQLIHAADNKRKICSNESYHTEIVPCPLFSFLPYCLVDKNPQQHVPLEEYSANLKEIVRHLDSAGVTADKVIFITPPPLHEPAWEKECILKGQCPGTKVGSVIIIKCLNSRPTSTSLLNRVSSRLVERRFG